MDGLTFSDQFLQLSTRLASKNIYGLGEHMKSTFKMNLDYTTWPMFSRDQAPTVSSSLLTIRSKILT